jgi:hypothetical protein
MAEEELKEQVKDHFRVKLILAEQGNHVSLIQYENKTHEPRCMHPDRNVLLSPCSRMG